MSIRRRVTLGLLAIAFGVVATYATAWAAVWWGPIGKVTTTTIQVTADGWTDDRLCWPWTIRSPLLRPTDYQETRAHGLFVQLWFNMSNDVFVTTNADMAKAKEHGLNPILLRDHPSRMPDGRTSAFLKELTAGWPLTCLRFRIESTQALPTSTSRREWGVLALGTTRAELSLPSGYVPRVLPTHPLWPRFFANVGAWGGAFVATWMALIGLIRRRRTARRRRRGLCVACGYDLAGLAPRGGCPECGTGAGATA